MNNTVNEQELVNYICAQTKASSDSVKLVLKHEQAFIGNAKPDRNGDVDIDGDELTDYIVSRRDVKLDELTVELILDAEMDFYSEKGLDH